MSFAVVAAVCLLTVPLLGGRLMRLADVELRWVWVAVAGLGLQVLIISVVPGGDGLLHEVAHLASYVLVGAVVVANRHVPYLLVVGAGGALNFLAIAVNGGVMPASASAIERAGGMRPDGEFLNSTVLADPKLAFLGDVFPLELTHNVYSVGDVVMALGALACVHAVCGSALALRRYRVAARPA